MNNYSIATEEEAIDENGNLKEGYEKWAYCHVKLITIDPTYNELRRKEYPDYREYLDGIVKGDTVQVQKYIDDCLAVKKKYPKE